MYLLGDVLKITFLDEVTSLLCLFCILFSKKRQNKLFMGFFAVFLFFLIHSFLYSANPTRVGILLDGNQQIKPYMFFFFFYLFPIKYTNRQLSTLKSIALTYSLISCIIGSLLDPTFFSGLFRHPYNYVNCMFSYAILYLFCSHQNKQDIYITFFILTLGLLGLRTKFLGNYALFIFLFFFLKEKLRIRLKYIILIIISSIAIYYISQEKIDFYARDGLESGAARTYLYWNVPQILVQYFPFGSGFASYSTWFSGVYYSPLYYKYDMNHIYGLTPDKPNFVSDTYFPNLVQIGVIGIILLFLFWKKIFTKIKNQYTSSVINYKIGILILGYIIIESLAGAILVMHLIYVPMMILGIICKKINNQYDSKKTSNLDRFSKRNSNVNGYL